MMNDINNLFFELIQVALGSRICLSHTPAADEWGELYAMAKKQSLVGVCFAGVQKLKAKRQEPPEMLYLTWMGMAAKILQRNEQMDEEVRNVWAMLDADGLGPCIMKGQSVMKYYPEHLRGLRQSGDIDVLVAKDDVDVLRYAREKEGEGMEWSYKHVHLNVPDGSYVDLHYRLAMSRNLWRNARIQQWCRDLKRKGFCFDAERGYATLEYNDMVVHLLLHALWHFLFEGVGMRQMMDLYFALCTLYENEDENEIKNTREAIWELLKRLKLEKFASACAWMMWTVFEGGREDSFLLSHESPLPKPNEVEGRFLLSEIVQTGNFGHQDERKTVTAEDKGVVRMWKKLVHYMRLVKRYPSEFLWLPIGAVRVRCWRWKTKRALGLWR